VHALLDTRVSGAEHQREGLSLDAQTHATRSYAAMQGWAIAGEYQDILSGARDDRPRYQGLSWRMRGSCMRPAAEPPSSSRAWIGSADTSSSRCELERSWRSSAVTRSRSKREGGSQI
jgi:hypothetical protein